VSQHVCEHGGRFGKCGQCVTTSYSPGLTDAEYRMLGLDPARERLERELAALLDPGHPGRRPKPRPEPRPAAPGELRAMGVDRDLCVTYVCPAGKKEYYERGGDRHPCPFCDHRQPGQGVAPVRRPKWPRMSREEWIARFRAYFPASD
jgi:hypothetical protein